MPLTTVLFVLTYVAGCLLALRYPLVGVITYLLVYFMHPPMAWWGKPVAWLGIRYSLVVSACTAIGIVANWQRLRFGKTFWHRQEVLFAVFVGTMWLSLFSGLEPCHTSYEHLDKMTKLLIFVLMMTHVVTDLRSYRALVWAIAIGLFYLGYQSYTAGPASFEDGRLNAIGGPDFDRAPELGVHFAAMLPFVGVMLLTDRRRSARVFLLITAALTCNGIVLTRTRSAMTALVGGMGWALAKAPRRWRSRLICLGLLGACGAYSLTDQKFWERMATILTPFDADAPAVVDEEVLEKLTKRGIATMADRLEEWESSTGRIPTWKAAWAMWKANPLGVGIGNFTRAIEDYPPAYFPIDAHNTVVLCFAELGIPGITAFLLMLWVVHRQIRAMKRTVAAHPGLERLAPDILALETAIVVFLVGGMTVSRLNCEMFWCLMLMPVCLERAIANALASRSASAPAPALIEAPAGGPLPALAT